MSDEHWTQFIPPIHAALKADGSAAAWHYLFEYYHQGIADAVPDMALLLEWAAREGIGRIPTWDPRFNALILPRGGYGWTAGELMLIAELAEETAPTESKEFAYGELFMRCSHAFGADHPGVRKMAEALARN